MATIVKKTLLTYSYLDRKLANERKRLFATLLVGRLSIESDIFAQQAKCISAKKELRIKRKR